MEGIIPEFGQRIDGIPYTLRPGGYGVVRDAAGLIAVVATPGGLFLLGGGQDPGESPEDAFVREAREECRLEVRGLRPIGVADELVFGKAEQIHFRKRCTFFAAMAGSDAVRGGEPDHALLWLPAPDAIARLAHASQRWAVRIGHLLPFS
jgi:8-oxo-dGTP diphosphatase